MPSQRIHIVPHDQGWALKREGQNGVESVHPTQKEAIDAGRDIARQDEVDLVVHRQDGTFRNVLTYTNDPMNDNNGNGNGKRVQAHDLFSVGSRVSWGAILAGAAIALAVNAALWMGGVALGVTFHDRLGPRVLTIAGALWVLFSFLVSLFLGGFAVSRITTGENKTEAVLYGVVLWGVMFAVSMFLAGTGASAAATLASLRPTADQPLLSEDSLRKAGIKEADIDKVHSVQREGREAVSGLSPTAAAWWSFATLILSMGAAVLGSLLGAGPDLILVRTGTARTTTAQPLPT